MKNKVRTLLLLIGDVLVLLVSFFAMLFIRFFGKINKSVFDLHFLPFSIIIILWLIIFFIFNLYDTEKSKPTIPYLRQIMLAFITATAIGAIFFYVVPAFNITPKTNLVVFGIISFFLFTLWRRFFYNIFSSSFRKSVVFIIEGENCQAQVNDLKNYFLNYPQSGFIFQDVCGSFEQFQKKYSQNIPEVLIVSKEVWHDKENFKKLYNTQSEVMNLAYAYEDILGKIPIEAIDEGWFVHNVHSYNNEMYDWGKRIVSVIIASFLLIITLPVVLIIALAIKFYDRGPIFYSQMRVGKNNKYFKLYKFRSMIVNADHSGAEWTTRGDSRITKIGKIIRKLHIDEIPQLWNILKGEMTLVGPRPEIISFADKLEKEIPFYYLRHIITPGFTGWAQIKFRNARGVEESKEKFEYDLYYIKNRNIFIDFGILLRTIIIIFTHN